MTLQQAKRWEKFSFYLILTLVALMVVNLLGLLLSIGFKFPPVDVSVCLSIGLVILLGFVAVSWAWNSLLNNIEQSPLTNLPEIKLSQLSIAGPCRFKVLARLDCRYFLVLYDSQLSRLCIDQNLSTPANKILNDVYSIYHEKVSPTFEFVVQSSIPGIEGKVRYWDVEAPDWWSAPALPGQADQPDQVVSTVKPIPEQ